MCYCCCRALYVKATFKSRQNVMFRVNRKNPIQSYVLEYSMLYEIIKGFKTNLMQERFSSAIKNCAGRNLIRDTHHIVSQLVRVLQIYSN